MRKRDFVQPTAEEIESREKMYEEAERLGIDLMSFDGKNENDAASRDIRKAIVYLGTGKSVPKDLEERILKRKTVAK
ncbi:MAG: hypothetical protein IKW81_09465 [Pseudobutyrivibrio sp.]|uniref:hypothetical protein n=1 Tax=Pseudobutyrivibrio ruminis TaxID=46206 RepID=UPI0001CCE523|nr:hypothetical protein [Pseudobutyrivibrio ruminis]MBR5637142.1 hypothetical protein [Pseudobutyrivibrio sp.]MDC7278656.1 hypothetical protein [Butyrivibrio fibrisolvens]CBK74178.1 hypothetical protein CIY_13760 [Butyrivibrio fibrisolvens 16/4]